MNTTDMVQCCVHLTLFPRASSHEHHEAPRAAGGSDDPRNLIWLCANCHTLAHRLGQLYSLNRRGEANDIAMKAFPAPSIRTRMMQVVKEIVEHTTLAEDYGLGKDQAVAQIAMSHELYSKLKLLANEVKGPGGRKLGVARYILAILEKHVRSKGLL